MKSEGRAAGKVGEKTTKDTTWHARKYKGVKPEHAGGREERPELEKRERRQLEVYSNEIEGTKAGGTVPEARKCL